MLREIPGWSLRRSLWLALAIIVLDQATKLLVLETMPHRSQIAIWSDGAFWPGFNLVHVWNTGAAFSFLADAGGWQRYVFLTLAIVVSVVLLRGVQKSPGRGWYGLSVGLIVGGAIGNAIDRAWMGAVVDFLDVYIGAAHWPAFNIADVGITVGVIGMVASELGLIPRRGSAPSNP